MPDPNLETVLQLVLALGLLNVWLLRAGRTTSYRGGPATSLREEFRFYGLPDWSFALIGVLKVGAALALLAGLWVTPVVTPAAALLVALMLGAIAMHVRVRDPLVKAAPAALMLVMSGTLLALEL